MNSEGHHRSAADPVCRIESSACISWVRRFLPCDSGGMKGRAHERPGAAEAVGQFVYGDVPLDEWVAHGDGALREPWSSFEQARQMVHTGRPDEAVKVWRQIASTEGLESRQVLQAWHFLRQVGYPPPADQAKFVLGVVAEIPVEGEHDLLAAYRDGSARYLNHSGKVVVWEDRSVSQVQAAIGTWLARGQVIAGATGPWDQPSFPPLLAGHARVMVLTPGGPQFGQGPLAGLSADPVAGSFISAAFSLMQLLISRAIA